MRLVRRLIVLGVSCAAMPAIAEDAAAPDVGAIMATIPAAPHTVNYDTEIRPMLESRCFECHAATVQKAGLRLDHFTLMQTGGDNGPAIKAGDAAGSLLFQVVAGLHKETKMPPKGDPLRPEQLGILRAWLEQGAPGPAEPEQDAAPTQSSHWAFQPIASPAAPTVANEGWARNDIDRFILARLEKEGVSPSPEAEETVQLRRLHLDLTGLPPSPEEVDAYLADTSPYKYEKAVNRLLASPHFGERWARHWLDLARYADSDGFEKDTPRPWAWRYRHWVIDAINRDLPYDEFLVEQLAGDLLPNATQEQIVATGFHRNTLTNLEGGVDPEEFRVEQVYDRTNTTGQVVMGLTVGCAQCHTHKYDPISHREYYQLFSFFNAGMEKNVPAPLDEEVALYKREKAAWDTKVASVQAEINEKREELKPGLAEWEKQQDTADIAWTMLAPASAKATANASDPATLKILTDGSILATGARPQQDVYEVAANTTLTGITAFRVEALIDGSLPNTGPGRADDGNFVLTDFDVTQKRLATESAPPNLAIGATVSSPDDLDQDGGATGDAAAIDGNFDTFWDETDNQGKYILEVTFPQAREVSSISIQGYEHRSHAPKDFQILCDGELAHEVKDARYKHNLFVEEFPARTCTTLRLEITGYYGGSPAIRELGIYGGSENAVRAAMERAIAIRTDVALADHEQPNFPAKDVLDDGNASGWAIGGGESPYNRNRNLIVAALSTAGYDGGTTLNFTLQHKYQNGSYTLGRFRLYATTDPRARVTLPQPVREALRVPADQRTPQQAETVLAHYVSQDAGMRELLAKRDGLGLAQPQPPATMAQAIVQNPEPPQTHIHLRGSFLSKGDPVEPGVPAVLPALHARSAKPDRLDLARWLVSPEHPLTARVAANRVWDKLFGKGLVSTPEDFGTRTPPPSHPELLDFLARRYMQLGWSTKDFIREIVTSATYRQSSHRRPDMMDRDPENTLLCAQNAFRVEAEITRDMFMAASGLLHRAVGGPSVYPPLPPGITDLSYASSVTWPQSSGEDIYRRGMYIHFQRTIPFPQLMAFDCPDSNVTNLKRSRSNTPLQALMLLNDPAFVECAQNLAGRMLGECGPDAAARARWAFKVCMGRPPQEREAQKLDALFENVRLFYADKEADAKTLAGDKLAALAPPAEAAAYTVLARTMMNLDEFLTRE